MRHSSSVLRGAANTPRVHEERETPQTTDLSHHQNGEKEEQNKLRANRMQKVIKIRAENSKIEKIF